FGGGGVDGGVRRIGGEDFQVAAEGEEFAFAGKFVQRGEAVVGEADVHILCVFGEDLDRVGADPQGFAVVFSFGFVQGGQSDVGDDLVDGGRGDDGGIFQGVLGVELSFDAAGGAVEAIEFGI